MQPQAEYSGDYNELIYLRARYYAPEMGRFLTRDIWEGDPNNPMSFNRWSYVQANPINLVDPTGLFPRDLIFKNIDYHDFEHLHYPAWLNHGSKRMRYGFLALLLDAEDHDMISVGYLQLQKPKPTIGYFSQHFIWQDCETIYVDGQPLKSFYETQVKSQREPWIWWRDTSASYYQLNRFGSNRTYIDGDYSTDLPYLHSIDLGIIIANFDLLVDLDGNFYFSVAGGNGVSGGFSYTESYLCQNKECFLPLSNPIDLIKGYCINGGGQIGGGYQLSICSFLSSPTAVQTFSTGFEAGYSLPAGSWTFPLGFALPRNPEFGWRAALDARKNGIHRSDIQLYP